MCFSKPELPQAQQTTLTPPASSAVTNAPPATPVVQNGESMVANQQNTMNGQTTTSSDQGINPNQIQARRRSLFQIDLTIPNSGAGNGTSGVPAIPSASQTGASFN